MIEATDEVQVQLEALRAELRPLETVLNERLASEAKTIGALTDERAKCLARIEGADERAVQLEARRVKAQKLRQTLILTTRDRLIASLLASAAIGMTCVVCATWVMLGMKGVLADGLMGQGIGVTAGVVTAMLIRRRARARLGDANEP